MALRQVGARTEGDVYQGLFFWHQAAALLIDTSRVTRVEFEHDIASGVDDVVVFYDSFGVNDRGHRCTSDFFQVKYHVDQKYSYSSDNLIDPLFIRSKTSLLHRFYEAYLDLCQDGSWFRLNLVSNWHWSPDDPLAKLLREADGALPEQFFTDKPSSALGKIRESWRAHLGIDTASFYGFAQRLRIGFDHFGRRWFQDGVHDRLASVGLRRPLADRRSDPYIALYHQFLLDRTNKFDRHSLMNLCRQEGLLAQVKPEQYSVVSVIGLRSFMRFADRIEDETDRFVCVAEHFDGRHVRDEALWTTDILPKVCSFLNDPQVRKREHHLLLDCHGSLAFLAGYEFDRKSGALVYPVQKGDCGQVWKRVTGPTAKEWTWTVDRFDCGAANADDAVAISVTHDVLDDVRRFLEDAQLPIGTLLHFKPSQGVGPSSIVSGDHAVHLAELAMQEIRRLRRGKPLGRIHIFASAPNGFLFYLGHHREALGSVQLYEFDFSQDRTASYLPSFALPICR